MSRGQRARRRKEGSNRDLPARYIVPINQEPLRERAAAECSETMALLERARVGWYRFERKDKPAFGRWWAREFGALLSTAREVETQISNCQTLIHEVEMEMRRGFQDAHGAYVRVMFRRANPSAVPRGSGPS